MTVTPRNHPRILPVVGTAIAIVLATLVANRLMATPGVARPQLASQITVGVASEGSAPALKQQARYQATIDNWRRYRANNASD